MLGDAIKLYRTQKNLSEKYLASKLKISQSYYSRIERNIAKPNTEQLKKLATEFDIDEETLQSFNNGTQPIINIDKIEKNKNIESIVDNSSNKQIHYNEQHIETLINQLKIKDEQIQHLIQQNNILLKKIDKK